MPQKNPEIGNRVGIAILAKAPIPGLAKTRLIPHLGADGAAALQRWLLQRTVAAAIAADIGPVTLWGTPTPDHPDFAPYKADAAVNLRQQPAGDLGERMHAAIAESATPGGTLVIGTDCALLTPERLQQAAAALIEHDALIIPAEDGGYVLIGLRQADQRVFSGIAWSTGNVMAETRERLHALGWRWTEMSPLWDIDRPEDYQRLCDHFPEAGIAIQNALAPT